MSPRAGKQFRTSEQAEDLAVTFRHAAGIDVYANVHFVAVPADYMPAGFVNVSSGPDSLRLRKP